MMEGHSQDAQEDDYSHEFYRRNTQRKSCWERGTGAKQGFKCVGLSCIQLEKCLVAGELGNAVHRNGSFWAIGVG